MLALWIWMTVWIMYLFRDIIISKPFLVLIAFSMIVFMPWGEGAYLFLPRYIAFLFLVTVFGSLIFIDFILSNISEINILIITLLSWYMYSIFGLWKFSIPILLLLITISVIMLWVFTRKKEINFLSKVLFYVYHILFALILIIIQFPEFLSIVDWNSNYSPFEMFIFWMVSVSLLNYVFYLIYLIPFPDKKNWFSRSIDRVKTYCQSLAYKFSYHKICKSNAIIIILVFLLLVFINNNYRIISDIAFINFIFALSYYTNTNSTSI